MEEVDSGEHCVTYLGWDSIRQWDRGETESNHDLSTDNAIDIARIRCNCRSDEGDCAGTNQKLFTGLKRVRGKGLGGVNMWTRTRECSNLFTIIGPPMAWTSDNALGTQVWT